jgi:hypothetical protein
MLKGVEKSTGTVSDIERRAEVDVEDERGTSLMGTGTTNPSTGDDRCRTERAAQHCPRRPRRSWAGERPS